MIYDHTNTYKNVTFTDCATGRDFHWVESVDTHTGEVVLSTTKNPLRILILKYGRVDIECADIFGTPNKFYLRDLLDFSIETRQP